MKNKLIKGLFGLGLGLSAFAITIGVNALTTENITSVEEGSNSVDASVTVGNVETPVYEVEITWDGLTFDWSYNEYQQTFMWDNISGGLIQIRDKSNPGRIYPSVEWNSADGYDWTKGEFFYQLNTASACTGLNEEGFNNLKTQFARYIYTDSSCSVRENLDETTVYEEGKYFYPFIDYEKLITTEIPENGRSEIYNSDNTFDIGYTLRLQLSVDSSKDVITPKTGDTIGTVTITIN